MDTAAPVGKETIVKNMPADVWFEYQKQPAVQIIDTETIRIDGEKLVRATFWIDETATR